MAPGVTYWAYVGYLLLSALGAAVIGYWVYTRTDARGKEPFAALMALCVPWTGLQAVSLLLAWRPALFTLTYARHFASLTGVLLWGYFAFEYAERSTSLRNPLVAALTGGYVVVALALVTDPFTNLYWSSLTVVDEPFTHMVMTLGPATIVRYLWVYLVIGAGLLVLAAMFLNSRHRSRRSLLVLLCGSVVASVPNLVTLARVGPLPGFDYTPFGVFPFAAAIAYAVFRLDMFDVRPVARDNLVEHVDDALLVLDRDEQLIDYNRAAQSLSESFLGSDPVGEPFSAVVPPVAGAVSLPEAVDEQVTEQVTIDGPDGREHYSVLVTPVARESVLAGYSVVLRDITDIEEYQRELERKNKQLDEFASTVSHDLRNPLQSAIGRADLVHMELDEIAQTNGADQQFETVRDDVTELKEALTRMEDIIADLRTLVKKGESIDQTQRVDFLGVVTDAWDTAGSPDATLTVTRGGTIEADRSRLRSILENLIRNAIDHVGPSVHIEVALTEDGFYVADDGPGIPPDERGSVFEYGFTTSEDGTGFGLSIVRTMAESHDWRVTIDDDYGAGTKFLITDAITEPESSTTADTAAEFVQNQ